MKIINAIMSMRLSIFLIFLFYSGMNDAEDGKDDTIALKRKQPEVVEQQEEGLNKVEHSENDLQKRKKKTLSPVSEVSLCDILAYSVSAARETAKIIRKVANDQVSMGTITKDTLVKLAPNLNQIPQDKLFWAAAPPPQPNPSEKIANINDFQTIADRNGQKCIVSTLKNAFPGVKIIGEEDDLIYDDEWIVRNPDEEIQNMTCPMDYANIPIDRVTIWVDPLDGTYGYVDGHKDHVTTLIGIIVDDQPVAGVIYQPFWDDDKGRAVWGMIGDKIHGLEVKAPPPVDSSNRGAIIVTTTGNPGPALEEFLEKLRDKNYKVQPVGGSGNKVLYLLEGKAHGYIFPSEGPKRWDTAAPEALLNVAGADLTDIYGLHYKYGKINENNPMDEYGIVANAPSYSHDALMTDVQDILLNMKNKLTLAKGRTDKEQSAQSPKSPKKES